MFIVQHWCTNAHCTTYICVDAVAVKLCLLHKNWRMMCVLPGLKITLYVMCCHNIACDTENIPRVLHFSAPFGMLFIQQQLFMK